MKYEVGDVVRIQSKEWFDAQEKNEEGNIYKDNISFVEDMLRYAGKIAKIEKLTVAGYFRLDSDIGYDWADWMFDPNYDPTREPLPAKDAAQAMLDGETLYDKYGNKYEWRNKHGEFSRFEAGEIPDQVCNFNGLYRRPVKRKRLMNRWEIMDWANSEASRGWVVFCGSIKPSTEANWYSPQYANYSPDYTQRYWKARMLPDLSGIDKSTIQQFEVEE
jgi:hypothetical protein